MDLKQRQIDLEQEMTTEGIQRYYKHLQKAKEGAYEDNTPLGQHLIASSIEPMVESLDRWLRSVNKGKPGRHSIAARYLGLLPAEVSAFIAARLIFSGISGTPTLTSLAISIGRAIEDEVRWTAVAQADPKFWKWLQKKVKHWTHYRQTKTGSTRALVAKAGDKLKQPWTAWEHEDLLHIGLSLVDRFIQSTAMVKIQTEVVNRKTRYALVATEATTQWLERRHAQVAECYPVKLPMLVPPTDWTGPTGGGYLVRNDQPIIKSRNREYIETLKSADMTAVYSAINALQRTAWKINEEVLEVANWAWQQGLDIKGIPRREPFEMPPKILTDGPNFKKELGAWKKQAHEIHKANRALGGRRIACGHILRVANRFRNESAIYFPYQLDFRGRAYAVPNHLNPQGEKLCRGLLRFAQGKPIVTNEAEAWLAIHGANTFGFDKATLEERQAWTRKNESMILACAENPLDERWWAEADSPWEFLAFCFEWAAYRNEGRGYVSCLPVSVDGTCNGLQHYSAMLRDSVGGAATNLVPSGMHQDIYRVVAERVNERLTEIIRTNQPDADLARGWQRIGVDRSITKRPVMVVPYGATRRACYDYVHAALKEAIDAGTPSPFDDTHKAAYWLAKMVWDAIGETVIAARAAMDWLKESAKAMNAADKAILWKTPAGMPILQSYPDIESRRIKTRFGDSTVKISFNREKDGLSRKRQRSGIAPNFVHSMDGAALALTIAECLSKGVSSFHFIHDSYGTLAADMPTLGAVLRDVFVRMYTENDVLEQFKLACEQALGHQLPDLPPKGSLDLNAVRESKFFFA